MNPPYIKTITKTYANYKKIIVYKNAWLPTPKKDTTRHKNHDSDEKDQRNVSRARTAIFDLVASNTFDYFVTLTISPDSKLNRYDYDNCAKYLSIWLKRHITTYILVPEKHKDGAYHFHLLANIPDSQLTRFNDRVYNIKSYKYGYSTAVKITVNSEQKVANYIKKYITKDLVKTVGTGKKRYWSTRNLKRPTKEYNLPLPKNAELVHMTHGVFIYNSPLKS